jgi:hypothetical protein
MLYTCYNTAVLEKKFEGQLDEIKARYNEIIVPKLQEMGIEINDLNAVVSQDILKYIREDDKIHLTEAGIEVCAKQVVKAIKGE